MSLDTKKQLPDWFEGEIYQDGDIVTNPLSGESCELNALELSMYDLIKGCEMAISMGMAMDTQHSEDTISNGKAWFKAKNIDAYIKLFDDTDNNDTKQQENGELEGHRKSYHENGQLSAELNYKNGELEGLCKSYHENGQLSAEAHYKNGKLEGRRKGYHENGELHYESEWVDDVQNGEIISFDKYGNKVKQSFLINGNYDGIQKEWFPNGKIKAERIYKKDLIVSQKCWDESGNEINIGWFDGIISEEKIKIRKYHITSRYIFSPKVLWLSPLSSSIISHLLSFLYSNCNYEMSLGGGGIRAMELTQTNGIGYDVLTFKDDASKTYLEDSISAFKENFRSDYDLIFYDKSIDDVDELAQYKMLIYDWTFSSLVKEANPSSLFKKKYLSVSKGVSKDYKSWLVLDKSVKPSGIAFDSDEKDECVSWINQWEN